MGRRKRYAVKKQMVKPCKDNRWGMKCSLGSTLHEEINCSRCLKVVEYVLLVDWAVELQNIF